MKIILLGHEAEVKWISSRQATSLVSRDTIDSISVFFELKESIDGLSGFGIEIPPKEYTVNEFVKVAVVEGEKALQIIISSHEKEKAARDKRNEKRKKLNRLVGELGERIDVEFHPDIK